MGIMRVYDITNEKSFENIKNWIRNIEENASADVEKMLLGNKCELNEKRQVRSLCFFCSTSTKFSSRDDEWILNVPKSVIVGVGGMKCVGGRLIRTADLFWIVS